MEGKNIQQGSFIVWTLSRYQISMTLIAQSFGCDFSMVNRVIWGQRKSPEIQAFIANILGYRSWADLKKAEAVFNADNSRFLRKIPA